MSTQTTYVGRREYSLTNLSAEYLALAQGDEKVGLLLIDQGQYRHGIYFLVQAVKQRVELTQ